MKTSLVTFFLMLVFAPVAACFSQSQPSDEEISRAIKKREEDRSQSVTDAESRFKKKLSERPKNADRRAWIESVTEARKHLIEKKKVAWTAEANLPGLFLGTAKPGDFGVLSRIDQNMTAAGYAIPMQVADARVLQVIDSDSVLVFSGQKVVWIDDMPTGSLSDNQPFEKPLAIYVTGTTTYESKDGQKTIPKAVPLSDDAIKRFKELATPKRNRDWKISALPEQLKGELVDFDGKKVTIKKPSGESIELNLSRLSKADRDYVTESLGAEDVK